MMESINKLSSPELLSEQIQYKFYSNNGREGEGGIICTVVLENRFKNEWMDVFIKPVPVAYTYVGGMQLTITCITSK